MCVVDFHRIYRNSFLKKKIKIGSDEDKDLEIRRFSDQICGKMREWQVRIQERIRQDGRPRSNRDLSSDKRCLEGISGNGEVYRDRTKKQASEGEEWRNIHQQEVFICRKYLQPDGKTTYRDTVWHCSRCKMPICKQDRRQAGRQMTCYEEHCAADENHDEVLMCKPLEEWRDSFNRKMPDDAIVPIMRRSSRLHHES